MAGTIVADTIQDGAGNSTSMDNAIYGSAKAWVKFNATAVVGASYNVSSVTRNSTGIFTITFTNAFSDANYATNYTCSKSQSMIYSSSEGGTDPTTTAVVVQSSNSGGTVLNPDFGCVTIHR